MIRHGNSKSFNDHPELVKKAMKKEGNLPEGYIHNVPLPRVPRDQSTFQSRVPTVHAIPVYYLISMASLMPSLHSQQF